MKFVDPSNTVHRPGGAYGQVINKIVEDGVCPFCPEHLAKYHKNPTLKEGEYWLLTKNAYPYKGAQHHFLLIHKAHIEHFTDLTPNAWQELQSFINEMLQKYDIKGGTLMFRFGETKFTGASVAHLHAQIVVGPGEKDAEAIIARVG